MSSCTKPHSNSCPVRYCNSCPYNGLLDKSATDKELARLADYDANEDAWIANMINNIGVYR